MRIPGRKFAQRIAVLWSYGRALVLGPLVAIAGLAIVYLLLRWLTPAVALRYLLAIALPVALGIITTIVVIMYSPYLSLVVQLGRERTVRKRAGLALVISSSNKVLLAKQKQPPWETQWIPPGGYFNQSYGKFVDDTARERLQHIVGPTCPPMTSRGCLATSRDTAAYRLALLAEGHVPTDDRVYLFTPPNEQRFSETTIPNHEDLKWASLDEITKGSFVVPIHFKELIERVLSGRHEMNHMRFWVFDESIEGSLRQETRGNGDIA
jgi:hypothetical protein